MANAVNAVVPLVLLPIMTRYLSPAEYGVVAMFQTVLGFVSAFVGLSASGSATRKYYEKTSNSEYSNYIGACLLIILMSAILLIVPLILLEELSKKYFGLVPSLMYGAIFLSAMNAVIQLRLAQWQIRNKASNFFNFLLLQGVTNFTISFVFIVYLTLAADGRVFAQVITGLAFGIVSIFSLQKDGLLNLRRINSKDLTEILSFGIPLLPHMASAFLLGAIDRVVINRELGSHQVGIYMVAVQCAAVFGIFFDSINKAFTPWLFEKLNKNQLSDLNQIIRWTYFAFFVLTFFAVASFFFLPTILIYIVDENYYDSSQLIGFLVVGQIFSGMYYLVTNYIFYSKKTIILSALSIISGLMNLILLLMLVPNYGVKGAAFSFMIAAFMQFIFTWYAAFKLHPMPWFSKDILDFNKILKKNKN